MTKGYNLQIRINDHEAEAFFRAAAKQGMEMSTWVRWVAVKAAADALSEAVEQLVPREPPKAILVRNPNAAPKRGDERVKVSPRRGVGVPPGKKGSK